MISTALIRDENLHPTTRWILISLLSNKPGWKINAKQFVVSLKPHGFGRDKVLSFFKQACAVGYMKKEVYFQSGLKRTRYLLSERPKFKESLPRSSGQDLGEKETPPGPGEPTPVSQAHKYYNRSSKEELNKEKNNYMKSEVPKKPPTTPESLELAKYLLERRKKILPKMLDPDLEKWGNEIRLMNSKDGRTFEEIKEAIDFAMEDSFWCRNILSADKLRSKYDQLYAKMLPIVNTGTFIDQCRDIAREIKNHLNAKGKNNFQLFKTKCFIGESNQEIYYNMNPSIFEQILIKAYNLRISDV